MVLCEVTSMLINFILVSNKVITVGNLSYAIGLKQSMKYREYIDRELKLKLFQRPQSTLSFSMQIKYVKGIIRKVWL